MEEMIYLTNQINYHKKTIILSNKNTFDFFLCAIQQLKSFQKWFNVKG
jgi:hypothetical protein